LDSAKNESAAKEKLIENENQSDNDGDASETKNLASEEVPNQSEEIAKAISYKVVNFLRSKGHSISKEAKEIKNENFTIVEDLEKKENESDNSIANLLKDENFFYKEENTVEINNSVSINNTKKKKRNVIAAFTTGLNSIKYRLKKNYFLHKET